ncbi:Uncharacterised protein [Vibrio cholerae]|nr:Uncharacterised protein [Vibrio cholerae]
MNLQGLPLPNRTVDQRQSLLDHDPAQYVPHRYQNRSSRDRLKWQAQ